MKKIAILVLVLVSGLLMSCGKQKKYDLAMKNIPGKDFKMLETEVTRSLYKAVMKKDPTCFAAGENGPVEYVSWYDAIYFCNKLSELEYKSPVYALDGEYDVSKWGYTPHEGMSLTGKISQSSMANGYRLPTEEEWEYAAKGGEFYEFAGSDYIDEVGWYIKNSSADSMPVAQKKANKYGLYDMSGNVAEWCWDSAGDGSRYIRGGGCGSREKKCKVSARDSIYADQRYSTVGFRIVCR